MRNRPSTSGVKSIRSHSSQIARPQTALNRGQSAQKTKVGYRPKNRWNNEEYQDNLIQIAIKKVAFLQTFRYKMRRLMMCL